MSEAERTARQQVRYDRHNASHRFTFAKSNMAPDCFVSTSEMDARRRRRLDSELTKNGDEWSLSKCSTSTGCDKAVARASKATSAVAAAALRTAQQEAERLLRR